MLRFDQVEQHFSSGPTVRIPDWQAARGEHWLVLGPSGGGKSTLLHLAAGLLSATTGRVSVADVPLDTLRGRTLDRFRARHVGLVFQTLHLVEALTVRQNLALAQYLAGLPVDQARISALLEHLDLPGQAAAYPRRLSQGQAQRVAIARAVLNRPALILADEPTSALDDHNCERVLSLLVDQAAACGATLVIATHDRRLASRIPHRLEIGAAA
ncbi:MAG: ATP-binding cassette domain-containing protein [Aquisalimonadaceae bacterium]